MTDRRGQCASTTPKRSSKASRCSTAIAWAKRLAVTVKRSRKPTLAEQDQPEAVPAFDEPNESFPLAELVGIPVVVMEA